jgi:FdrA protein
MTPPAETRHVELRRGAYRDSVRLMQISQAVSATPGVSAGLVAMATPLNLDLAAGMGFAPPSDATANDMLVAIAAADDDALRAALARLDAELNRVDRPAAGGQATTVAPRTVGSAARLLGANLTLVSTPGRYAFVDAMDALDADTSVMVFSDNVSLAEEIRLKDAAAERGLLAMGPDCGTAVIGGVGLGFANVVRPGPVGIVAASGTGAQHMMALLDAAGVGVSHVLGVGGRDLSAAVAGRGTLAALDALDADDATDLIVVISKPPAPEVAARVREHAGRLSTPVVFALLDAGQPDLTEVAAGVLRRLGAPVPSPWPSWLPATLPAAAGSAIRGLFSGGTLCYEAMLIASGALGPVRSNTPLRPEWALPADLRGDGHLMIDFGDDTLTQGRPHPMIDGGQRLDRLAAEAADPACGVVLMDVVLGHGAHPDPAAELAPAIAEAKVPVVVSLTGTAGDPQGLARQATLLRDAGAAVYASNAEATRRAIQLVTTRDTPQ